MTTCGIRPVSLTRIAMFQVQKPYTIIHLKGVTNNICLISTSSYKKKRKEMRIVYVKLKHTQNKQMAHSTEISIKIDSNVTSKSNKVHCSEFLCSYCYYFIYTGNIKKNWINFTQVTVQKNGIDLIRILPNCKKMFNLFPLFLFAEKKKMKTNFTESTYRVSFLALTQAS